MSSSRPARLTDLARSWPLLAAASTLAWAYWPSFLALEETWATDPRYSHGFLVPLFSLYLCWSRKGQISGAMGRPSAAGILMVALGIAMHLGGAATNHEWVELASILPTLAGLCVLAGGWTVLRPVLAPITFLVFMIPLPYRVELALGGPLQGLATHASAILLQLFGLPALEQGNTITLGHSKIGVVEACNGLSMLMFFFAISAGLILCTRRPVAKRALIIAGAVPIALVANIARITATALLVEGVGHGIAGLDFHDLAGYLMMPFALALLFGEMYIIDQLFYDDLTWTDRSAGGHGGAVGPEADGVELAAQTRPASVLAGG